MAQGGQTVPETPPRPRSSLRTHSPIFAGIFRDLDQGAFRGRKLGERMPPAATYLGALSADVRTRHQSLPAATYLPGSISSAELYEDLEL
jgi:hypothetical protein